MNEEPKRVDRMMITIDGIIHEVDLYDKNKRLEKNRGYLKGDFVYIYQGKLKNKVNKTGIYKNLDGNYVFIKPKEFEEDIYHKDNLIILDINKILQSSGSEYIDPEDAEIINNNTEVFKPTIKDDDNFLKLAVKQAIIDKEINLKNYTEKFPNGNMANKLACLRGSTKMTVPNFEIWCDALGLKWTLTIEDNGKDSYRPLKDKIILGSEDF